MTALTHPIEDDLQRLTRRVPDLAVPDVLLSRLLVLIGRELAAILDQKIRPHGLNEVEFRALVAVFSRAGEPAYPSDLCVGAAQSPANITRITDALVERGLITRVPSELDRRRLVLRMTTQGEALVNVIMPTLSALVREVFAEFSPQQKADLMASLKQLAQAIARNPRGAEPT